MPFCYLSPLQINRPMAYSANVECRQSIWLGLIGAALEASTVNGRFNLETGRVIAEPFRFQTAGLLAAAFFESFGHDVFVKALLSTARNILDRVVVDEP